MSKVTDANERNEWFDEMLPVLKVEMVHLNAMAAAGHWKKEEVDSLLNIINMQLEIIEDMRKVDLGYQARIAELEMSNGASLHH